MNIDNISIIGAGTMGAGIAYLIAQHNFKVVLVDSNPNTLINAEKQYFKYIEKLNEKGKISNELLNNVKNNITFTQDLSLIKDSNLVIEAIIEDLNIKKDLIAKIESYVSTECIIGSNTSSLSIASLAGSAVYPKRILGIHFFNPATIMQLVEIIPSILTDEAIFNLSFDFIKSLGKICVKAKDTPGFIVNRIARPFYGEALRIYEEGIAEYYIIDEIMKKVGGFKMGPFELMDLIGNDVNYKVTETVFENFYYDPRFKPSIVQKRLVEAALLGKKSGRGFYNYNEPETFNLEYDDNLAQEIFLRIISMLINEAYDALNLKIATIEDIDLSMKKATNYPKGLFEWAEEIGINIVLNKLSELYENYLEDRYRPNILLKRKAQMMNQ